MNNSSNKNPSICNDNNATKNVHNILTIVLVGLVSGLHEGFPKLLVPFGVAIMRMKICGDLH